jgi:hypothetical protein
MKYPFDDPFRTYLERMLEEQRRFEELIARSMFVDLAPIMDQYIAAENFAKTIQSYNVNVEAALGSLRDFGGQALSDKLSRLTKEIQTDLQRGTSFIGPMERIAQLERKRLDDLFLGYRRLVEQIADQRNATESALAPARQLEAALASIEAAARLFDVSPTHWSNSLSLVEDYEVFALRQAKAVERDSTPVAQRRMRVTELAGELLATSVTAAELGAEFTADEQQPSETSVIPRVQARLYGPLNQHLGFVYRVDLAVTVDPAVAAAIPTRICELGGVLVFLVTKINQRSGFAAREQVFRVTTRSLLASSLIPSFVTGSEAAFGEVIDALYFLLYEGAGGTKNRLTDIVSDEVLAPLWRLKHLRLHYRHDIEHGDDRDIKKKYKNIAAAFRALCGRDLPSRPGEWTIAQVALYAQLVSMLERIEEAIVGPQSGGPPNPAAPADQKAPLPGR